MRDLLSNVVAASNHATSLDRMLTSARQREAQLERQERQAEHKAALSGAGCAAGGVGGVIPVAGAGWEHKRPRDDDGTNEADQDLAMKVLEARAAAQSERTKRMALARKMRAATRELESAKRSTPKRTVSRLVLPPQMTGSKVRLSLELACACFARRARLLR